MKTYRIIGMVMFCMMMATMITSAQEPAALIISTQERIASDLDSGSTIIVNEISKWRPEEVAIIVCDMWDKHWCKSASGRVDELAPRINDVLKIGRKKGVLIIHAPSDVVDYYKDSPQRKLGKRYTNKKLGELISHDKLDREANATWPIDQSNGGCDCETECTQGKAWTKQHGAIEIMEGDAISDSGEEIAGLFSKKGINNVIMMGVHTNMCIVNRSFGLRNMVRLGKNVVLMRDLTDVMYDADQSPNVSHFTGTSLMLEYIETYISPTIVSTVLTGKKQFRFKDDDRPIVAFVTADGEYRSNQRLPEFAHELLLKENVNCEFALGLPNKNGEGRHNLENLQILEDADLALFFLRRRALEYEKMKLIRDYVSRGKPVIGMRTASHGFDARKPIPHDNGVGMLAQWPQFDKEVLGGNYQGHYGHLEQGTKVSIIAGMEDHPLLNGFPLEGYISPNWLYKNRPLSSPNAQVLLTGTIPGEFPEPVFWINLNGNNVVICTSLGHWDDWEDEGFSNLMINSIRYLLGKDMSNTSNHEKTDFYK